MTRNAGKPWTADDIEELTRLIVEERLSDKETGERMGRSLHSVETQRNSLGLPINSKPGHSRKRVRAYHREQKTALGPSIHADPAAERARTIAACREHYLDVAQMFGTTPESVISEYTRRCEVSAPSLQAVRQAPQSWFIGSACSSSAGWLE